MNKTLYELQTPKKENKKDWPLTVDLKLDKESLEYIHYVLAERKQKPDYFKNKLLHASVTLIICRALKLLRLKNDSGN